MEDDDKRLPFPSMVMVLVEEVPVMALNVTTLAVVSSVITVTRTGPFTPLVPMAEAKADQEA